MMTIRWQLKEAYYCISICLMEVCVCGGGGVVCVSVTQPKILVLLTLPGLEFQFLGKNMQIFEVPPLIKWLHFNRKASLTYLISLLILVVDGLLLEFYKPPSTLDDFKIFHWTGT